jgi:prepilin signal peptidase PulO-like enzyme (type II secretory pathway)
VKDFKLFELSATENSMGSIVSFVSKHIMLIIGALILLGALVLWLLFKLIRWIIRKITGKNNKGD